MKNPRSPKSPKTLDDLHRRVQSVENEMRDYQVRNKGAPPPAEMRNEYRQAMAAYLAWKRYPPIRLLGNPEWEN